MDEDTIPFVAGGETIAVPRELSFYLLRRAWPHIARLGAMATANQAVALARLRLDAASPDADRSGLEAAVRAAEAQVTGTGSTFMDQTGAALDIIAAALSLTHGAPTAEDMAKRLRPSEFAGVHECVQQLLEGSGLTGEATAAGQRPARSNGADLSPSLSPTA
jgi:hypothetical protein